MWKFKQKFYQFMSGRYGADKFNYALLILYLIVVVLNMFFSNIVLEILSFILFFYIMFRIFSRQTYKRAKENMIFLKALNSFTGFFKYYFNKIKYIKTKVYCKCPNCKAVIRLPRKKGKHAVNCPKCHKDFNITVRFK